MHASRLREFVVAAGAATFALAVAMAVLSVQHRSNGGSKLEQAYAQLPLAFEPNLGRTDARVDFLARGGGATMFMSAADAVLALRRPQAKRQAVVRMHLVGARPEARLRASERLPGIVNEFLGNDPTRWRTNIPTFARLSAADVYPGIDLVYHGRQGGLEYDFLLAPGADPASIALRFEGSRSLRLDRAGNLLLALPGGVLRQDRPRVYQRLGDRRERVAGRFVLRSGGLVGFTLGRYDRSRPLVIDPTLSYSTYLGGSGDEEPQGIAVDSTGSAYVTGITGSSNFPATAGAFDTVSNGGTDVFVAKLNSTGTVLSYATYVGGSGDDEGASIAVDSAGNAYVTGLTGSSNFPFTAGAFDTSKNGVPDDAFVTKVNPTGSALSYSTYLGSTSLDEGTAVAVDSSGSAHVTGLTNGTFPTTAGALDTTKPGGGDGFVTKLDPAGSALSYSTYLGGTGTDVGAGIALDSSGDAYLTGDTDSTDFPTVSPLQAANGGGNDAFVAKLNSAGTALAYSTYLGGTGYEEGHGSAVDSGGSVYVTGLTDGGFPTVNALQPTYGGGTTDAFVAKVNSTGSALSYATYLGGSDIDEADGIAVDSGGAAHVTGLTDSTDFPTATPLQGDSGLTDAFVAALSPAGNAFFYSTYLGGSDIDFGADIALDGNGNAHLTGVTSSTDFTTTAGVIDTVFNGGLDAFVAKISGPPTRVVLGSFAAVRVGRGVLLRWRTASEISQLGFHVYRQAGGKRVRLNRELIPAGPAGAGRSYSFRDRLPAGVRSPGYWLEEVHLDAVRVRYGPVRPR